MTEVEVISKCLVGAAATTAERSDGTAGRCLSRLDLTPWDLQLLLIGTIQKGLLFHKPTAQQEEQLLINSTGGLIDHLKTSLSSALAFYPPAAGRFATETNEDHASTLYVDCNNAGVEFVVAKAASATVAAILDPSNDDAWKTIRSFFPLNRIRNWEGIIHPLMGVQVTELVDGYFVACTLNHVLADGTAFWNFFHSWSELSRGLTQISTTPILERWFPYDTKPPIYLPPTFKEKTLSLDDLTPSPLPEKMFHLTKESIAKLKERANEETGAKGSVSSLQAYMAHIWICVTRARGLDSQAEVQMSITIGTRARVPLPEGYWGNALYVKMVTAKAGEVLGGGLGWAAGKIKETVERENHEEVMKQYLSWLKSPVFLGEKKLFKAPNNSLVIGSSPRHDIYSTDFGWGKAVAVRSGEAVKSDGKVTLFAGREEGSVDIELCVHPRTLLGLSNDPEFLEYMSPFLDTTK